MRGGALVLRADGSREMHELSSVPGLEQLQAWVGGDDIEMVPMLDPRTIPTPKWSRGLVGFCGEHGKLRGRPLNVEASQLWLRLAPIDDVLVGDVVLIWGDAAFMRKM